MSTRTTIAFDDDLLRAAKRAALDRGTTLGGLVQDALRAELARREAATGAPFELLVFDGRPGVQPGVDLDDNAALGDLLDGDDG